MKTQYFSCLLSIYKHENPSFFKTALDSVFSQTMPPSEVVLVKDGPLTKQLEEVIAEFAEKLTIVDLQINHGLSFALNEGLKACNYDIVARMDTDDICVHDRFEKQLLYFQSHTDVDVLGSYAYKINERGEDMHAIIKVPIRTDVINRLIWTCPMNHPTVMFRKSKILSIGGYDSSVGPRQDDYDLWFRCVANGLKLANIPQPLLYYRFFSDSIKKNSLKVGWFRMKVGLRGCRKLHLPIKAYIGVCIPLVRSLLPYPLNIYFHSLMNRFNPRKGY